ncbi:MAG: iron-containing alcohol dehydrogenase [Arenicella sp.]|nr:iron-containing alcohol dehydrogenase [Arenicella sp.]
MNFDFKAVPKTHFAEGGSAKLADAVKALGFSKPFIVTDKGILQHNLLEPALDSLTLAGLSCSIFSDVQADPPEDNVIASVELARQNGCDGVIGFGGGSSMDVAKLVAALMSGDQLLQQMYGVNQITTSRVPLIQVPTTAGTGSEATCVSIVTTGESSKAGVVSDVLFADTIILDPVLTLGLPPHITAATGIDAMVHAIEAFTSKRLKNPISDMLALKALSLISSSIERAVENGGDLNARSNMLLGAMFPGQAFANAPVGAVHALAYPLGGIFHIPHGLSNSLVLPHVLRFNAPQAEHLYTQLLPAILPTSSVVTARSNSSNGENINAAEQLAEYFSTLAKQLGLETTLREVGVAETALEALAEQSMLQERLLINNPRTVSYDDALCIYQQAY